MSELETLNKTIMNLETLKKSICDTLNDLNEVIRKLQIEQTELIRGEPKVLVVYAKGYNHPLPCRHLYIEDTYLECHCDDGSIVEVPFDEITFIKKVTLDEYSEIKKKRREYYEGRIHSILEGRIQ